MLLAEQRAVTHLEIEQRLCEPDRMASKSFLRQESFDEEMRVHNPFLKNFAPLPGRAVVIGLGGEF